MISDDKIKGSAGGIIFYDKGDYTDGWRYLEAAPSETEFNAQWGAMGHDILNTKTDIGTGKANTRAIITFLQEIGEIGRAGQLCVTLNINGYNDWFLPSKDELNLLYENLHTIDIGDFGKGINDDWVINWIYWSSSQNGSYSAWYQLFTNGVHDHVTKNGSGRVRAIRAF